MTEKLVDDLYYRTLLSGVSQLFPILSEFTVTFEKELLINYLRQGAFKKFDNLIRRFLVLSKEPIKSNSYYILLNCILWTDEANGTVFDYILDSNCHSEKYSNIELLEMLQALSGLYHKSSSSSSDYLQLTSGIKATLKKNDNDIFRALLYSKNQHQCLIPSIASLNSNRLLFYLLKDKCQLQLLTRAKRNVDEESPTPLERILQDIDLISNNAVKQVVSKFLGLCDRAPIKLSSASIECLTKRNDSHLFKTLLDNTHILDAKSTEQARFKFILMH